ncbi:hypothetical protein NDU88_011530 [Pleurodeles waltl]|uniref:Uncharacterized protein n=1 Tax=Pleurodeles waltl TaxID=8319 RepID=A0AAV7QZD4_PLEWA|nr:hypothetical protein NDU88_011530 [Pleurodeles waltl]
MPDVLLWGSLTPENSIDRLVELTYQDVLDDGFCPIKQYYFTRKGAWPEGGSWNIEEKREEPDETSVVRRVEEPWPPKTTRRILPLIWMIKWYIVKPGKTIYATSRRSSLN